MVQKGDKTKYGTFIGEVVVDRPRHISEDAAAFALDVLESRDADPVTPDPLNDRNEYTSPEEARAAAVEMLRGRVICYRFETDDGEFVLRPAEYGEPDVVAPAPPPLDAEQVPDAPQPELGRFVDEED